jgi:hypothetical protein
MSSDDGKLFFYSILGLGAGIWPFFKGFREFRKYRVLADTPEIPIRSIPMGLVEIHGTAVKAADLLGSPVTHTSCCLYKVVIETWKTDSQGRGGSWHHHRTDVEGVKFYLQDTTGKVLVDPREAELDLPQGARCEAGSGRGVTGAAGATESELLSSVTQADAHRVTNFIDHGLEYLGPRSDPKHEETRQSLLEAFRHAPGSPDFQQRMATLMAPKLEQHIREMGPQSDPQKEQARLAALEAFNHPQGSPEFLAAMQRAACLAPPEEQKQFLAAMGALSPTDSAATMPFRVASGRYRLTEYCIVPGQSYDITGTAVENPHPQDDHDRNMIVKGQNEPTFLIFSKTEQEVEKGVRNRALGMILGGAALAIVCVAIILFKLGWM